MEQNQVMSRIVEEGIKPHAGVLAALALEGKVAVVVFEPGDLAKRAAREMGWDGCTGVFELKGKALRRLEGSDHVTRRWLHQRNEQRSKIFVIVHDGTLLMNFEPGVGFYLEPASTDQQALS